MTKFYTFVAVIVMALALGGCGDKKTKSNSQVVAKVGNVEITVSQLNFALQRLGPMNEAQAKEAAKQTLRALVEQEMLYQKAIEAKLDRDPTIVQALEFQRHQVLAQQYVARQIKPQKPSDEDIKNYYKQHPELFEQRRLYQFREVLASLKPEQREAMQKEIDKTHSMDGVEQWLRANNMPFNAANSVRAAEQMPPELLTHLAKMKDGQVATVTSPNGTLLLRLIRSQTQPVSEAQAKPAIERLLVAQKQLEAANTEVKKVRDATKIAYLGPYADIDAQGVQAAKAAPAVAASNKDEKKADTSGMDRGLSGLK